MAELNITSFPDTNTVLSKQLSTITCLPIVNQRKELQESALLTQKHILLCTNNTQSNMHIQEEEFVFVKNNFCGIVFTDTDRFKHFACDTDVILYLCGDIEKYDSDSDFTSHVRTCNTVNVVKELSFHYSQTFSETRYCLIELGEVPINVFNVGVLFRNFFSNTKKDYFDEIVGQHQFQSLTESNKETNAYRKGIYLTRVDEDRDGIHFGLLRCSTNLDGPTDNFRDIDQEILTKVNHVSKYFFTENATLNHVLAQIYYNHIDLLENDNSKRRERKARIKKHSDKTKDMPKNGLMAFCSFYKNYFNNTFNGEEFAFVRTPTNNVYDYWYKGASILTRLRFRLKSCVTFDGLEKTFDVVLYPNSLFLMSLFMNRLYTHEIVPSTLPVEKIPTRMGYVIRCSNTKAVFKNNETYIIKHNRHIKLEQPTEKGVVELKKLYVKENTTDEMVFYDNFYFSLNEGDYTKPIV